MITKDTIFQDGYPIIADNIEMLISNCLLLSPYCNTDFNMIDKSHPRSQIQNTKIEYFVLTHALN